MPTERLTRELLAEMDRWAGSSQLLQADLCDPRKNEHALAFFVTRFCKTLDEERGGAIEPIRDWAFVLKTLAWMDELRTDPSNGIVDKSRRMLFTWLACANVLWRAQYTPGFPAFMTTGKGGDYVDDGGDHSTPKSMFGRVRFMYDRLPDHVRRPIYFAFKRIVCTETHAYISGESPTEHGGRAGGYVHALIDETAFLPYSESLHRALNPACKDGRLYGSTANGPANVHARLIKRLPSGWRKLSLDWDEHPDLAVGVRDTTEAERDRYGDRISPRFVQITADLRDDDIAQEYLHSTERSLKGLVYKEFNLRKHVPDADIELDPTLPLYVGADYGSTGFGAAVAGQKPADWALRCIVDYELEGAGGAEEHALQIARRLFDFGYRGELPDVRIVGGPDTNTSQTGSGQSIGGYFRKVGFHRIQEAALRGPGSVDRGITVVCVSLRQDRIRISPACERLIARFGEYRWPMERGTNTVKRTTKPVHNSASHIMDAFRYLVTEVFPKETGMDERDGFAHVLPQAALERSIVDDDDDDSPPRMGPMTPSGRSWVGGLD